MPGRLAIDFGTSNTVVAVWDEGDGEGKPFHIPDYGYLYQQGAENISVIPSLIHYTSEARRLLGNQVKQGNLEDSNRTFRWMKRYISNRSPRKINLGGRQISYFEAGKDFLSTVLLFAGTEINVENEEVALTVPVEAFEHYENWLTEVAETAGMPRFRLIDEPSAAALGYGAHIQPGDVYLIFDFGGGTLDVSIVLIEEEAVAASRRCRVLGKAGCKLGGTTIDQWLYAEVLKQNGRNDYDVEILQQSGAILVECEQAKIRLSSRERSEISFLDVNTGTAIGVEFTRGRFEEILDEQEVFTELNQTIRRALNASRERGYSEDNIKAVLMVGGSSQIPSIQRSVRQFFGKDRVMLDRPLDAVARGAAAFVAGVDFYDHIQHDYAIRYFNTEKGDYDYRILVKRGTNYPTQGMLARLKLKATHEQQSQLGLAIFELGEGRRSSNEAVELVFDPSGAARLTTLTPDLEEERSFFWMNEDNPTFLRADPPAEKGKPRFEVTFSIDGNKRLLITAKDLKTGKKTHINYPVIKLT
ncbi:MAG: Hsp70 family protein [Crocinitomicaceae bacterium]|nr:Hsp70 family protein [Crocinitomicaceae bacterium]